jgi:pyruvyl transferase EpsO
MHLPDGEEDRSGSGAGVRDARGLVSVMRSLKQRLRELLRVVPEGSRVALLDGPVHRNVGDLLIERGTEQFLADHGMRVVYRASVHDYRTRPARRALERAGIVLCHGGGHLGDLYPHHQVLRERVVRDFSDRRVVILPQSVKFLSTERLARAAEAFRGHPDLHLYVRDVPSLEAARELLERRVTLLPDMAHYLWPLSPTRNVQNSRGTLFLMRADRETAHIPAQLLRHRHRFVDWHQVLPLHAHALTAVCAASFRLAATLGCASAVRAPWRVTADALIRRGVEVFLRHRSVVTSRLHGMILALLLERTCVVLDNSYGKVSSYYRAWLGDVRCCRFVAQDP